MNCDVYKLTSLDHFFLLVPHGKEPAIAVPRELLEKLGRCRFFRTIVLDDTVPGVSAQARELQELLAARGYHLQRVDASLSLASKVGAALGAGVLATSLGAHPPGALLAACFAFLIAGSLDDGDLLRGTTRNAREKDLA